MSNSWENQFNKAETNSSSEYMDAGSWLLRIDKIARGENRKGVGNFKLEGTVVHHFSGSQKVGASITDMYSEKSDFFFSEVKAMIAGLAGKSGTEVTFDDLLQLSHESQPLKGMLIEYTAWEKLSKAGFAFTKTECKGMKTQKEWLAVASPDNVERFADSLRFKKEA